MKEILCSKTRANKQGILVERPPTTVPRDSDPNNFVWIGGMDYDKGAGTKVAENSTKKCFE